MDSGMKAREDLRHLRFPLVASLLLHGGLLALLGLGLPRAVPEPAAALARRVTCELGWDVSVPAYRDRVTIE